MSGTRIARQFLRRATQKEFWFCTIEKVEYVAVRVSAKALHGCVAERPE